MNMMEAFLDGVSLIAIAKTALAFAPLILPAAAGGPTDYRIARSLRFRQGNSGYLSRTPAGAGNRKTWTYSCWAKRGGTGFTLLSGRTDDSNRFHFVISGDQLYVQSTIAGASVGTLLSTAFYRDYSAWMHIVLAIDTTQATAANRAKLYVNGAEIAVTANYPAQNTDFFYNLASLTSIGRVEFSTPASYSDMYLADVHFIDGQALTPSSFGAADTVTGVWNPKAYAGTYGTNGFKLDFSDNSAATAGAIGADRSGNGNNWAPSGISITAGATNDSFVDTPTNYGTDTGVGGEVRGNYCVLNSLTPAVVELSNGNLRCVSTATRWWYGTFGITSGKWYWETTITAAGGSNALVGISTSQAQADAGRTAWYGADGNIYTTVSLGSNGSTFTTGDVIGVAFDADAGKLWFSKNGTFTGSPTAGTGNIPSGLTSGPYFPFVEAAATGTTLDVNFGQRPFAYTAPSGYKALCTQNLPDPTIKKPSQYFNAKPYTGNHAANAITGVGHQPDLLWLKSRASAFSHVLLDSVRGTTKYVLSDSGNAEVSGSTSFVNVSSLDTDGFTLGATSSTDTVNGSGDSLVAWSWKKGATPGFDIVTFTGTGANTTIAHSLGVAPKFMIVKGRSVAQPGIVWNTALAGTQYLNISGTGATATDATVWNSTVPSSSVFSLGSNAAINTNGGTYVAYLFAEISGFSKFGSYTGNGNANGPFVNCGFRPRWIMMKMTSSTGGWFLFDAARSDYNVADDYLQANTASVEGTFASVDFLSNGFKLKAAASDPNTSAATYIYAAFAENPFKYARAR